MSQTGLAPLLPFFPDRICLLTKTVVVLVYSNIFQQQRVHLSSLILPKNEKLVNKNDLTHFLTSTMLTSGTAENQEHFQEVTPRLILRS